LIESLFGILWCRHFRVMLIATLTLVFSWISAPCSVRSSPPPLSWTSSCICVAFRLTFSEMPFFLFVSVCFILVHNPPLSVCTKQFFFLKNREKCITGLVRSDTYLSRSQTSVFLLVFSFQFRLFSGLWTTTVELLRG
jgi:hypothetical protein